MRPVVLQEQLLLMDPVVHILVHSLASQQQAQQMVVVLELILIQETLLLFGDGHVLEVVVDPTLIARPIDLPQHQVVLRTHQLV